MDSSRDSSRDPCEIIVLIKANYDATGRVPFESFGSVGARKRSRPADETSVGGIPPRSPAAELAPSSWPIKSNSIQSGDAGATA